MQEAQYLLQIPAVDIQSFIQLPLDHIPGMIQTKVKRQWPHINEPNIVIAVGRCKASGSAARLHAVKNADILSLFNFPQFGRDDFLRDSFMIRHGDNLLKI